MKKNIVILSFICAVGLIFRLIFINKPDGLWNDEYVSYMIASTPFFNGFWDAVKSQCHMPLYYLYLKSFMAIFGQSDLVLRLTSVLTGILAIPVMYLVGNEFFKVGNEHENSKESYGLICAGFTAISSFLIYYSQEVRLYSLLFLISAIALLYTLRLIKNPNSKNLVLYVLSNILIILTHTIGFVYVFFNLLFVSMYLYKNYKKAVIILWSFILSGIILSSGLIFKILTTQSFSQWWNHFSISKIGFLFTDYFSPFLTNLTGAPDKFLYMPVLFEIIMLIPTILAIICIIKSLINNHTKQGLFLTAFLTVIVMIIASLLGKLVFVTKYSIEIYPVLILLACSCDFENKRIKTLIITTFCLISTSYIIFAPYSAPKMHRAEGHKIVADIISGMELKDGDAILLEYYPKERFEKYMDFSKYSVISINKGNFQDYMSENVTYSDAYKNGKTLYKELFLSDNNKCLGSKIRNEIIDNLNVGQSVVMVTLDSVSFYTPDDIKRIASNDRLYETTPLLFLVFSYIKKETFYDIVADFAPQRIEKKGKWTLVKFTKINNSDMN